MYFACPSVNRCYLLADSSADGSTDILVMMRTDHGGECYRPVPERSRWMES